MSEGGGEATTRTPTAHIAQWVATGSSPRASVCGGRRCLLCGSVSLMQCLRVGPRRWSEPGSPTWSHGQKPRQGRRSIAAGVLFSPLSIVSVFFPWPHSFPTPVLLTLWEDGPYFRLPQSPSVNEWRYKSLLDTDLSISEPVVRTTKQDSQREEGSARNQGCCLHITPPPWAPILSLSFWGLLSPLPGRPSPEI